MVDGSAIRAGNNNNNNNNLHHFGVHTSIIKFLEVAMNLWSTTLTVNGVPLGDVLIKRGIFQGDSLSPLLFVMCLAPLSAILENTQKGYRMLQVVINHLVYMDDIKLYGKTRQEIESLVYTTNIFFEDICMDIGTAKCNVVAVSRGRLVDTEVISLPSGDCIQQLEPGGAYRYLGIIEADSFKHQQMKAILSKEYKRRVRKLLQTKLTSRNLFLALNTYAVPLLRYSGGIVKWTQAELKHLDVCTRKLLTMFGGFSRNGDVDRLYVPRRIGGRGLVSAHYVVEHEKRNLFSYVHNSNDLYMNLVVATLPEYDESADEFKHRVVNDHCIAWREKPLHGQFLRQTSDLTCPKTQWCWLKSGKFTKELEGLIFAAQEQALSTNAIRSSIYMLPSSPTCRLCGVSDETVDHLTSCCSFLVQREYKKRHDKVASMLHWHLMRMNGFIVSDVWWKHLPEAVCENDHCKLLWDFTLVTDLLLPHNRPDITYVLKNTQEVFLIDIAVPGDSRMAQKSVEKREKYVDLKIQIGKCWKKNTFVIPIIVGALGSTPKDLASNLTRLSVPTKMIRTLQQSVLYSTAHILRRYLNI